MFHESNSLWASGLTSPAIQNHFNPGQRPQVSSNRIVVYSCSLKQNLFLISVFFFTIAINFKTKKSAMFQRRRGRREKEKFIPCSCQMSSSFTAPLPVLLPRGPVLAPLLRKSFNLYLLLVFQTGQLVSQSLSAFELSIFSLNKKQFFFIFICC